jgi:hypothetical protein
MDSDRVGRGAGAGDGAAGRRDARRPAVGARVVVDSAAPGWRDRHLRRWRPGDDLGSVNIGFGGLLSFLRITVLSIVLLGLGALVSWTTNVAEIAPA